MNNSNYVTLSNYTGYFANVPRYNDVIYNTYPNTYNSIPSAYQIIVQTNEKSKENYVRKN